MSEGKLPDGIRTGEPVTCRCGRQMVCLVADVTRSRMGRRIGDRYVYTCPGCPRRMVVTWNEGYLPQGEPRDAA